MSTRVYKEHIKEQIDKHRPTPPKARPAAPDPTTKHVETCLADIENKLTSYNFRKKDIPQIMKVFKIMFSDLSHTNNIKSMLLAEDDIGREQICKILAKTPIGIYTDDSHDYCRRVKSIKKNPEFPGTLFKPISYRTADFTRSDFPNETAIVALHERLEGLFTHPCFSETILPNSDGLFVEEMLDNLNTLVLDRSDLFNELVNTYLNVASETPLAKKITGYLVANQGLPEKLARITEQTEHLPDNTPFRSKIKHRNRLLLEFFFPELCPECTQKIYSMTKAEFLENRRKHNKYKEVFALTFEKAKDESKKTNSLFTEYWDSLTRHAEAASMILAELLESVQKYYFFPSDTFDIGRLHCDVVSTLTPNIAIDPNKNNLSIEDKKTIEDAILNIYNATAEMLPEGQKKALLIALNMITLHPLVAFPELSSVRVKSIPSTIEKTERYSGLTYQDILRAHPEFKDNSLFSALFRPTGAGKFLPNLIGEKVGNGKLLVNGTTKNHKKTTFVINNASQLKKRTVLGDITDSIGLSIVVNDYFAVERTEHCIDAMLGGFVIEKESIYHENSPSKAYHDVKYLVALNDYLPMEIQIKVIEDQVLGDVGDHDIIYKNIYGLSQKEIDELKPIIYGLLWNSHKKHLNTYENFYLENFL